MGLVVHHLLKGLLNDIDRIGKAASHQTEVNIIELDVGIHPLIFGIVNDPTQIRRDPEGILVSTV